MIKCPKCDNTQFRIKITHTETHFIKNWTCAKCGFVKHQTLQIKGNFTEQMETVLDEFCHILDKKAEEERNGNSRSPW